MGFDSIIFDLDGTIWDSSATCTEGWNAVLDENPQYGIHLQSGDLRAVMGKTLDEIEDIIFNKVESKEERIAIRKKCTDYQMVVLAKKGGVLYPNAEQTLKELSKRYKLFLVSNCENGYLDAFFAAHGLNKYFTDYEYWERTGLSKAENIRLVMERNGLESPVYVGDTPGDAASAHKAGIPFIYAAYGFGEVESLEFASLNSFEELAKIL